MSDPHIAKPDLAASGAERWAPAAAASVALLVLLLTAGGAVPIGVGYDDAIYVDLARSIAGGDGYRHGSLPGAPTGVHYPPLFPLWLALWTTIGAWTGDPGRWLALGNVVLVSAAAGVWTWWGIRALRLPHWVAGGVTVASLLIYPARMLSALAFSEPFSWLLLGTAALASSETSRPRVRALVVGLLPLVRTILLPYALALAWLDASDRRRSPARRTMAILLALAPTSLCMLWTAWHASEIPAPWAGSYGSYSAMYAGSAFSAGDVLHVAWLQLRTLLSMSRDMFSIPGALVVLLCLTIGLARLRRSHGWLAWGTAGYVVLVLLWPFTPERFIWGLLPLLALAAAHGALTLVRRAGHRRPARWALVALLSIPCLVYGRETARAYMTRAWRTPLLGIAARNESLVRWGRTLRAREPVATESDGLFALATGMPSFPVVSPDPADKVGRGAPIANRVANSLCAVGSGWIALTTLDSDVAAAVRAIVADSTARVRLEPPVQVGGGAVVARFTCR